MSRLVAALALLLAASAASAAPRPPHHPAASPFVAELDRQCPGRRLQDLTAGDLALIMEGFTPRLSPAQRRDVEAAVGQRCARIEAGLTCANNASLDAYHRLGVLRRFVGEACATTWTCRGVADCTQAKP